MAATAVRVDQPARASRAQCVPSGHWSARHFPRAVAPGSVVEDGRAVADELHQGRCALQFRAGYEIGFVQIAVVEADGAHIEAPALLDETGGGSARPEAPCRRGSG